MHARTWSLVGLLFGTILLPAGSGAQDRDEEEVQSLGEFFGALLGADWNIYAHGGLSDHGRFLLQDVDGGERALRGDGAWNVGAGVGVNFLPRAGVRLSYTYASTDLEYRDDDGDGDDLLHLEGLGSLDNHFASIEYVRTLFPADAAVTPFATAGFVASWWELEPGSDALAPDRGGSQFRMGAIGTLGLQIRAGRWLDVRLEAASASVGNPFTGSDAFHSSAGPTIDEPTKVGKTDYRIAVAYNFSRAGLPLVGTGR